jgi:hypothetical protein
MLIQQLQKYKKDFYHTYKPNLEKNNLTNINKFIKNVLRIQLIDYYKLHLK